MSAPTHLDQAETPTSPRAARDPRADAVTESGDRWRAWWRASAVIAVVTLVGAGCGGSAGTPAANGNGPTAATVLPSAATSEPPATTEAMSDGSQAAPVGGGGGAIVLNGDSHAVEQVLSCAVSDDQKEGSLDLAAIADGGQLQLLIGVRFTEQLVAVKDDGMESKVLQEQTLDLQGSAAGGFWHLGASERVIPPVFTPVWADEDFNEIDGPPLTVTGDRISGSMTLGDVNGGPNTVDIGVDISIPAAVTDCQL
jgi:hypothetical protein